MKKIQILLLSILVVLSGCKKDDEPVITDLDNRSTGESANELLSENKFQELIIEVDYMPGYQPTQDALDNLGNFLQALIHKPSGIDIKLQEINSMGVSSYSIQDISSLEENNRDHATQGHLIAVHLLVLDAPYDQNTSNSQTLGVAYRNTAIALFGETIHSLSDEPFEPATYKLETTVLNHEFGHLLGLVDIGSPMQTDHKDQGHGAHCDNGNCLMHYTAETDDVLNNLLAGGNIPTLDNNCKQDLKANGGK